MLWKRIIEKVSVVCFPVLWISIYQLHCLYTGIILMWMLYIKITWNSRFIICPVVTPFLSFLPSKWKGRVVHVVSDYYVMQWIYRLVVRSKVLVSEIVCNNKIARKEETLLVRYLMVYSNIQICSLIMSGRRYEIKLILWLLDLE